jgi:hypothetical protein
LAISCSRLDRQFQKRERLYTSFTQSIPIARQASRSPF